MRFRPLFERIVRTIVRLKENMRSRWLEKTIFCKQNYENIVFIITLAMTNEVPSHIRAHLTKINQGHEAP